MSNKIRWGVISTARIGEVRVIPAIQSSSNGEVIAIASRNLDRAQESADKLNIPKAYGSYGELLADPDIDAIYNPLPNSHHAEWAIKCAEAGKPMLCEKPLAMTADKAQMMVDTFKEKDILFAEAFMYRFHPQTVQVMEWVNSGAIGDVHLINASFNFRLTYESNIRLNKNLGGGAMMDVGCYCINIMRLVTGEEPIEGKAIAIWGAETEVDEQIVGILKFPSGVLGHLDASLRTQRNNQYEIRGSEGRIIVSTSFTPLYDEGATVTLILEQGTERQEIILDSDNHYRLMAEDFADALLNNRPPKYDPQDGVENMRVIDMLLDDAQED